MNLDTIGNQSLPSVIKDPFSKNKVTRIYVWYIKSTFSPYNWEASGKVTFKNGNTEAEQSFTGDTFDEVVLKIKSCIGELE